MSIKILEDEHKELILKAAEKALYYGLTDEAPKRYGFSVVEINKIKRTYDYANAKSHGEFRVDHFRKEFCKFIKQYDERRDVVFTDTFPELKEFYAKYSE